MKVALLNVKYSPNLGDGVIAECLERALAEFLPGAVVESCDLAGRADFAPRQSVLRRSAIAALNALPPSLSDAVARYGVAATLRRTLRPWYAERLADVDVLVVGGGQLIADAHLNFPTKIKAALQSAPTAAVAVHAVGVDRSFSAEGARLFNQAFAGRPMIALGVRDEGARANWRSAFPTLGVPDIRLDPALLAAEVYGGALRRGLSQRRPIALGVTDEASLRLHADEHGGSTSDARSLWRRVADAIRADGHEVLAFTNGAAEDDHLLRRVFPADEPRQGGRGGIAVAPRPIRPEDLVAQISGAALVIGHRLHAAILAYALGVPSIGFSWNAKMQGFFSLTDRLRYLVDPARTAPEAVAALARAALDEGLDATHREALIARASDDVRGLARALASARS